MNGKRTKLHMTNYLHNYSTVYIHFCEFRRSNSGILCVIYMRICMNIRYAALPIFGPVLDTCPASRSEIRFARIERVARLSKHRHKSAHAYLHSTTCGPTKWSCLCFGDALSQNAATSMLD